MSEILIAVPVLNRPERAREVAVAVEEATTIPYTLLFLCTPGDRAEIASCERTGASVEVVSWQSGQGDYARKINHAVRVSSEPWILMGADDLCFCPDWAENAIACGEQTGAGVVGTQDWGNSRVINGEHSTHPVVRRSYIEQYGTIDQAGLMLHEGYHHNFCDDELVNTAKHRGLWTFCQASEVPHLHPDWGLGRNDDTYRKGRSSFNQDAQLYREREHLWV